MDQIVRYDENLSDHDDPGIGAYAPPADEIPWLAAWLVSEGWGRAP